MTRPVFSPELGVYFVGLRNLKGWSQARAIHHARKLPNLTKNVLWRLERGKIKQPTREVLMDVATLYGKPYAEVAHTVAGLVYQIAQFPLITKSSDLSSHSTGVDSRSSVSEKTHAHSIPTPENIALLRRIRAEVSALDLQLRRIDEAVAAAEVKAGIADRDDSSATAHSQSVESGSRRVDRSKRKASA